MNEHLFHKTYLLPETFNIFSTLSEYTKKEKVCDRTGGLYLKFNKEADGLLCR